MSTKNILNQFFLIALVFGIFSFVTIPLYAETGDTSETGMPLPPKNLEDRIQSNETQQEKTARMKALLEARKAKYEELQQKWQERTKLREERKQSLTEIQAQRLEMVKKHAALSEARMRKALEHLSSILDKVEAFLAEQKAQGFDTSKQEAQLVELQTQLAAIEAKIDAFSAAYTSLEQLPDTQLGPQVAEVKKQARTIVSDMKAIRVQVKNIVRASR